MASSRPDLQAVPDSAELPGEAALDQPAGLPWWAWLAVVGFIVCAAGWFSSYRGAADLQGELDATRAELAGVETELRAHEEHLSAVAERSGALALGIEELAAEARQLASEAARNPRVPTAATTEATR